MKGISNIQFIDLQVTSFGFSMKPSSDLFIIKSHVKNVSACGIDISFPYNIRNNYVQIHKSCINCMMSIKIVVLNAVGRQSSVLCVHGTGTNSCTKVS
jgi:hypothetical protein